MNPQRPMRYVFVDSCSFTFWRAAATLSWYRRAHPDIEPSVDNEELMMRLESQYIKSLEKISKVLSMDSKQMLLVRDCHHTEVWRRNYFPAYKCNRDQDPDKPSKYGPYIKHLNTVMREKYLDCIRVAHAEADDIIGVLVRYLQFRDQKCEIIIVANDSDYTQLLCYDGVKIFNPKTSSWVESDDPELALESKITAGDSSDGIPAGTPTHLKRLLIDLSCIPRNIQDSIIVAYMELSHNQDMKKCHQYHPLPIQLGLCCINTKLRDMKIFCSRTIRLDTLEKKGIEHLKQKCLDNCRDLIAHLEWNAKHGIRVFRISSDLFPHKSNPKAVDYTFDFALSLLRKAGKLARDTGQRLTFHPGQYNVVGTPREDMFQKTILDLDWHAEVLDLMGCGVDSIMVVHGGGTYGDKDATKRRWITNFRRLPERVRRRLVLENCEKSFSIIDCIDVSRGWIDANGEKIEGCGVPVVLDTHHFDCYKQSHTKEVFQDMSHYIPDVLDTWSKRHIKPKMHISQQNPNKQLGAHSDLITHLPRALLEIPKKYGVSIDVMVEAKLKEQAIEQLYTVHPELDPNYIIKPKPPLIKIKPLIRPQPQPSSLIVKKLKVKVKFKV